MAHTKRIPGNAAQDDMDRRLGRDGPNPVPVCIFGQDGSPAIVDPMTGLLVCITDARHQIHSKRLFTAETEDAALGDAATLSLCFRTMPSPELVHFSMALGTLAGGSLALHEGRTWTAETGTLVPVSNHMRVGTPVVSGVLEDVGQASFLASGNVIRNPSGLSGGTQIGSHRAYGIKNRQSVADEYLTEWVLKPDTTYCVTFTSSSAGNEAQIALTWVEQIDQT